MNRRSFLKALGAAIPLAAGLVWRVPQEVKSEPKSVPDTQDISQLKRISIPLIRREYPELISDKSAPHYRCISVPLVRRIYPEL